MVTRVNVTATVCEGVFGILKKKIVYVKIVVKKSLYHVRITRL